MNRNRACMLILILSLVAASVMVTLVPEAHATITINPDGTITPPTANITRTDEATYTFTGNVNDTIWVQRSNIVIDGAGNTLRGVGGGTGIYASGVSNVTIVSVHVENFAYGIYIYEASDNNVSLCNITANSDHGIYIRSSTDNNITENSVTNNGEDGIYLYYSSNNSISGNDLADNVAGVHLYSSTQNRVFGNNMTHNGGLQEGGGVWLDGASLNTISGNNITTNTWHGLDLDAAHNNTISGNRIEANNNRGIMLHQSNYNNITGNDVASNYKGIEITSSSHHNMIAGNNITANENEGIIIDYSTYNSLSGNSMIDNAAGVVLGHCAYNNVSGNVIADGGIAITLGQDSINNSVIGNNLTNNYGGISLRYCSNNTLRNNTMVSTSGHDFGLLAYSLPHFINDVDDSNTVQGKPIYYWINVHNTTVPSDAGCVILVNCTNIDIRNVNISRNYQGVTFAQTTNATVSESNITNTQYCIWLWNSSDCHVTENYVSLFIGIQLDYSSNNTLYGNTITGCGNYGGVRILMSFDNTFYHNNFTDNYIHVLTDTDSINNWDNGYPDGGNYWDNFKDRYPNVYDLYHGIYQNETGEDGFWDGPYELNANNRDEYPIVPEFSSFILLLAVVLATLSATVASRKKHIPHARVKT